MAKELSLEYVQTVVPKQYKKLVSQDTIDEMNKLVNDPDYGEEFKDALITHTSVLSGNDSWSLTQYINAVKFYSLTAAAHSQVDAYIKVFPERLESRLARGQNKDDMRGEAARFNGSNLVNTIRQQALVPLHLVNQGTTQLAINTLTQLMLSGRSEIARVSAATALLKELRPPEAQKVELQVGLSDEAIEAQNKQTAQLADIALNQRKLLEAGLPLDDIQSIHVNVVEAEIEEEELNE